MKPDFSQIIAAMPEGIIETDVDGTMRFINEAAFRLMNLNVHQQAGNHVSAISTHLNELLSECIRAKKTVDSQDFKFNGKPIEVEIFPIIEKKKMTAAVFRFQERFVFKTGKTRLNETQLLQLQLDTVFNFSDLGIWILDGKGVVQKLNTAAAKLIGIKASDIIGKNIVSLAQKGVIDQALTPHILKSKRPATKLLHVLKTNRYVMSSGTPVLDQAGNILLVVVHELDITTLKSLQGQLEELRIVAEKYKNELSELNLLDVQSHGIISESQEMRQVLTVALKLARFDATNILILGESGTGKGLIAQFVHKMGKRNHKPFIQVNCAALPETLLEAELFGFEKGAFTGAGEKGKIGLIEMAQNGTILLDEIGELPLPLQSKLLKCLDDHEIMHIGGLKPIKINCTIIAATNRDLKARVAQKKFREDLYHRLNAFSIQLPSLRERPEDIVALSNFFLDKYNRKYGMRKRLSLRAIHSLQLYDFPGNVRELKNILKQGVVIHDDQILDEIVPRRMEPLAPTFDSGSLHTDTHGLDLSDLIKGFEKDIVCHAIRECKTTRNMATYLNTSQSRIARLLKKHQLSTKTHGVGSLRSATSRNRLKSKR
jgi:PAS domain S-box-containing protein